MPTTTKASGKTAVDDRVGRGDERPTRDREYLDAYLALCAAFPLAPIRDDETDEQAGEIAWELASRGEDNLSPAEDDYLSVLSDLIEAYEKVHHPFPKTKSTPAEMIAFMAEQHDMTADDVGDVLGDRSLGGKLLRGERKPSKAQALKLAERFHVSPALFLE